MCIILVSIRLPGSSTGRGATATRGEGGAVLHRVRPGPHGRGSGEDLGMGKGGRLVAVSVSGRGRGSRVLSVTYKG